MRSIGVAWLALFLLLSGCVGAAPKWTPGPIITESVAPYVRPSSATPGSTPSTAASTPAKPAVPDPAGALDVSSNGGGHFASPTGRIWCALADDVALCHFPKGMTMTKVPKPSKVCPGEGLDVTGVSVSTKAKYFCSGGAEALPQVDGLNVKWWQPTGYPKVLYDGQELATLPYDDKLVDGHFVCASAQAGITCGNTSTGAGFLISRAGVTFIK